MGRQPTATGPRATQPMAFHYGPERPESRQGLVSLHGSSVDGQPRARQGSAGTRVPPRNPPSTGQDGHEGPTWPSVRHTAVHGWASQGRCAAREPHGSTGLVSAPEPDQPRALTWPRVPGRASIDCLLPTTFHSTESILSLLEKEERAGAGRLARLRERRQHVGRDAAHLKRRRRAGRSANRTGRAALESGGTRPETAGAAPGSLASRPRPCRGRGPRCSSRHGAVRAVRARGGATLTRPDVAALRSLRQGLPMLMLLLLFFLVVRFKSRRCWHVGHVGAGRACCGARRAISLQWPPSRPAPQARRAIKETQRAGPLIDALLRGPDGVQGPISQHDGWQEEGSFAHDQVVVAVAK